MQDSGALKSGPLSVASLSPPLLTHDSLPLVFFETFVDDRLQWGHARSDGPFDGDVAAPL